VGHVYFDLDTALLDAAQSLCVALPAAGAPAVLLRLRGAGWALVGPLAIVATVVAITLASASADVITWIAFILIPIGSALAFGWAMHGARPWLAVLGVVLLAIAVAGLDDPAGRVARLALIMTSCATVGRLLAGATPLTLLKIGVVAMAVVDSVFIFGGFFHEQNAMFNAAAPAEGLPRLQVAEIGHTSTDYGDFFIAGVVGAILAVDRRPQLLAAALTFAAAELWNQLFLVTDSLPNTVPPAAVLVGFELWSRRRR
jgi:hypothetical protein